MSIDNFDFDELNDIINQSIEDLSDDINDNSKKLEINDYKFCEDCNVLMESDINNSLTCINMKTSIEIPSSFIKTMKQTSPEIKDKQIEEIFQAFVQDWLAEQEIYSGMSNEFETWLERDDTEDILEGLGL